MAGRTVAGCAHINLIDMAGGTLLYGVLPFQGPDLGMIKIDHLTSTVMTGKAIGTELGGMVNDELCLGFRMALCALGAGKREWLLADVAGAAGKWLIIVVDGMGNQVETGAGGVFKWLAIHQGRLPAIGHVAVGAIGAE